MPFDIEAENPWKKRDEIPYPKMIRLLPLALLYVLSALAPVFFASEQISMIAYVGLCAGLIFVLRMPRIVISVILSSFLPIAFFQSFSLGALILSIVAGTGCGAVLITSVRSPWQPVILPLIVWGTAFAITQDVAMACMTLLIVPAALLLAIATWTGQRRTTAICYTMAGFLLSVVALLVIYFMTTYGSIERDVIVAHFETQREWIVDLLLSMRDEMLAILNGQGMQQSEMYTTLQTLMSREMLVNLVALIYNILPAVVIVICSIMAYEAQSLLCGAYCNLGMKKMLTPATVAFTMSTVSAIIYLLTFFVTMLVPVDGLFMAVVQNFSIILTPGMVLVGYASVMFRFRTAKGSSRFFLLFLLFTVLCCSPGAIFNVLAFVGAVTVLISAFGVHMIQKMQGQGNDGPPPFDDQKSNEPEKKNSQSDDGDDTDDNKDA